MEGFSVGWLVGRSVGWLVGWFVDRFADSRVRAFDFFRVRWLVLIGRRGHTECPIGRSIG